MEAIDDIPPSPAKLKAFMKLMVEELKKARPIAGRNVSISVTDNGTVVNAEDCAPCP